MNKVFKVIYSEARNAYVVVSEMAKSHGTKSCSTKKLLAMLIATGIMTCASVAPAMAANLAPEDTKIEAGDGANASGEGSVAIGNNAQASGLVAIAIGRDAVASGGDSIAIGSQTKATKQYSVAVGNDIGFTAYAGTAVGQQAYASGDNSTAIGNMTNVDADWNAAHQGQWRNAGVQSTAIGAYAGSWGLASTAVGGFSKAEGQLATAIGYHSQANVDYGTALGDYSEVKAGWGAAIGASSVADREAGVVGAFAPEGADSLTWKANAGAVSVGSETITRQITNVAAGSEATDAVNVAQLKAATENAGWNLSTGKEITNPTKVKSGATVDFSGDDENITVSKEETDYATLVNVKLNRNLNVDSIHAGDFFMNNDMGIGFGGEAYITQSGLNANDKVITNVAAGVYNTDAVNVGQLKEVEEVAANANKGWNLSTNGVATSAINVAPGEYVDFSGDKNISVSNDGTKVKAELNKDLVDIESISNGDAKLALGGLATELTNGQGASVKLFGDTTTINNAVTVYKDGRIAGVAAGINDNDAVNVGQLKNSAWKLAANGVLTEAEDVKADDYVDFSGDQNVSVSKDAKDGVNTVKVGLNKDLVGIESVSNDGASLILNGTATELTNGKGAAITLFGDTTTINNKVTVYNDGRISGVAAGINDTDAVNVSQLKAVGATANMGWNLATNGVATEATNVKPGDYVDFSGDKNISVNHDGTKVKVELNKDLVGIESISNGDAKMALNGAAGTAGMINGKGASVYMQDGYTVINSKVAFDQNGKISGVAAGTADTDAVNVSQLKNSAWKLAANGVLTEAEDVKAGDYVDLNGDQNVSVSKDAKDGVNTVKVELNKDLKDIESISNGDAKMALNGAAGTAGMINGKGASVYMQDGYTVINSKVAFDQNGKISGVAAGTADTDAVNVSQLKAVGATANMGWNLATNGVATEATNVKPGDYVDFSGDKNISVNHDGTKVKVELNKDLVGIESISNGDAKMALNGAAGTAGMINGKGASVYMQDGYTVINSKVAFDQNGKISGVAAGAITADSTDAVNGSQLHAVATEAGKHSKVVNGSNINVEEFDNDGQKFYKVNMNKDIMLGDLTGKNVSISGTNGTIEATGAIATKDRVYADKGAKLADIDVTGNKISNGASSIVLDGSNVKVNDKVTIDQNGKISGVAAGEVSKTSTDAINGSQLNQTNENVAALDKRVTQNEADIAQNKADIAQNKADIATNKADIATNKADIATNKANIAQNAADIKKVEELAKKHTTVAAGDNITVTEDTNKDGGKEYKVALDKDIKLDSVTTGQTVMNNDGLKVGDKVSVTATAVTAGKTSISDEGVKVGDKTYISADGLNANDQKITNVKAGDISETSKDAVNGSQLYKTNQEVVNNTNRINKLGSRVNKVGAGAAALAALHPMDFDPDDKLTFSAGYGNYAGENAAAIGAYYRPDEKVMFSVAGTVGNGENMVNAGVSFALDRTNHVSNSRTALAREVIDLRGQLAVMGAKMAKMEKAFGMLDETKTKLFPDVPANHWAYEYIAKLAGNGYIEGYPDGNFGGDRLMTRYEFAAMLYRAIENGAALEEKIIKEFEPELGRIRVDRISGEDGDRDKIERVRVNDTKGERDHYGNKLAK